jgi:hypothetical protein
MRRRRIRRMYRHRGSAAECRLEEEEEVWSSTHIRVNYRSAIKKLLEWNHKSWFEIEWRMNGIRDTSVALPPAARATSRPLVWNKIWHVRIFLVWCIGDKISLLQHTWWKAITSRNNASRKSSAKEAMIIEEFTRHFRQGSALCASSVVISCWLITIGATVHNWQHQLRPLSRISDLLNPINRWNRADGVHWHELKQ